MACSSSSSSFSSSSSSTHQWKYEVFLGFRGKDTRKGFTDHLHTALCQRGINTFMDDQIRRGEQIPPALLKAIEESRFSIIILSENYASSSWCLEELVKIVDCIRSMGHAAIPVFYKVDPSDVKKLKGSFAEAFAKHEQIYREKMEKVVKWREALIEVATISGWDSRDRHESKLIEEIVRDILNKLVGTSSSYMMKGLVGMESRIEAMDSLLCIGLLDVRMVGIWGMAGMGKTTIAKAIYERIYTQFEGCCFLSNVREESEKRGLTYLEEKLISQILGGGTRIFYTGINFIQARLHTRKALIVLDDVDNQQQLEALAGNNDWFGPGSRIIITTRDKGLLNMGTVVATYEVEGLNYDEAHKLFRWYAFKQNPATEDYMQLCNRAVLYIKGLPLALTVLGSFLCNNDIDEWTSALEKLERIPHENVQKVLKISYDGLDHSQKEIFLDIACFFKGEDRDFVAEILESYDVFPLIDIRVLINKSLITVSNNKLCMHDLLQEMGWEIVRQGDVKCPGKRSRLWLHDEVNDVLTTNTGTEAVEGIVLDLSVSKELNLSVDAFAEMSNLRLLRFCNFQVHGSSEYLSRKEFIASTHDAWRWRDHEMYNDLYHDCKLHLSRDFKFPSNNLRSLHWDGYPLKSLPSNFHPKKLVELNLCSSRLEQLWDGNKAFEKLKFIKLSHSQHLTKTPDFSGVPHLWRLILEGCTCLVEVHPSIGALKELIFLNLKGCKRLKKFPDVQGNMEHLTEISLDGTAIKGLPSSIEYLTGLVLLNLKECKSLKSLPSSIFKLKSLKTLILSNCARLKKLPEILENMETLMELLLDGSGIRQLPSSIGRLNGLFLLNLTNCKKLASLPQSICELTSLRTLTLSGCSELKELPDDIGSLQCLVEFNADGSGIQVVPPSINLLTNLQELSLAGCKGGESKSRNLVLSFRSPPIERFRLPSLSGLSSSRTLNLSDCNLLEGALPSDLSSLSSLVRLDLSRNSFITIPGSLSQLPLLEELMLTYCKSLQSLPELPSSLEYLNAIDCTSLKTFPYPSSAYTLKKFGSLRFEFSNCFGVVENEHSDIVDSILLGIQLFASIPKLLDSDVASLPLSSIDGQECPQNSYDAFVPGSRIPEWFVDQSMGSSVTVELPSHWLNTKLMGMAFCAVVGVKGVNDPFTCPWIHFTLDDGGGFCFSWAAPLRHSIKGDHIWFAYRSLVVLVCVLGYPFSRQSGTMVVSFRLPGWEEKLEVKKCGVRLVYEGEEKDSHCRFPQGTKLTPIEDTMWPGEGDESDSESKDLRQSISDSESKDLGQSCSPCNLLTNFFMLLKHICVVSEEEG